MSLLTIPAPIQSSSHSSKAYFFNYLIDNGKEYWHEIIIERDEVMIELIKNRILEATEIKNEFIQWLSKHPELGKMTRAELDAIMSKRTW